MGAEADRDTSGEQDATNTDVTVDSQSDSPDRDGESSPSERGTREGGIGRPLRSALTQQSSSAGGGSVSRRKTGNGANSYVNYDAGPDHQGLAHRYGVEFASEGQAAKVQRLESEFGRDRVHRWVEEGMTVETMGKPRDMQAFRERQESRPAEVPTDVERRNEASLRRSTRTAREGGPAGETQTPDVVRSVISSPGQALDETVQREMEDKMGEDFGDVRIHTGPQAAAATESIDARAFTVGNHVAFNRGEYDPSSSEGKRVLAHELTHVRQGGGEVNLLPKANAEHPGVATGPGMCVQPKLEVSSPGDPAEKEAEAVAEQVIEMDDGGASTRAETDGQAKADARTDDEDSLDRQESVDIAQTASVSRAGGGEVSGDGESKVRSAVQGGGKPLPSETRSEMESKMGADFSDVEVHTGAEANEAAQSINAEAYTMGSDIAFSKGSYNPDSQSGKELLAHELTHTIQQGGAQRKTSDEDGSESSPSTLNRTANPATVPVAHRQGMSMPGTGGQGGMSTSAELQEGPEEKYEEYTVKSGDYLMKIARDHGVEGGWQELYEINRNNPFGQNIEDPDLVYEGQTIAIPKDDEGGEGAGEEGEGGGGGGASGGPVSGGGGGGESEGETPAWLPDDVTEDEGEGGDGFSLIEYVEFDPIALVEFYEKYSEKKEDIDFIQALHEDLGHEQGTEFDGPGDVSKEGTDDPKPEIDIHLGPSAVGLGVGVSRQLFEIEQRLLQFDAPLFWGIFARFTLDADIGADAGIGMEAKAENQDDEWGFPFPADLEFSGGVDIGVGSALAGTAGLGLGVPKGASIGIGGELEGALDLDGEAVLEGEGEVTDDWMLDNMQFDVVGSLGIESSITPSIKGWFELMGKEWDWPIEIAEWELFEIDLLEVRIPAIAYGKSGTELGGEIELDFDPEGDIQAPVVEEAADAVGSFADWVFGNDQAMAEEIIEDLKAADAFDSMDQETRSELLAMLGDSWTVNDDQRGLMLDLLEMAPGTSNEARYIILDTYFQDHGQPPETGEDLYDFAENMLTSFWSSDDHWERFQNIAAASSPLTIRPWGFRPENLDHGPRVSSPIYDKHIAYYRHIGGMEEEDDSGWW